MFKKYFGIIILAIFLIAVGAYFVSTAIDVLADNSTEDLYWTGDGGNWEDPLHWSAVSGVPSGGHEKPTITNNVFFDANSFTLPGQEVETNNVWSYANNLDFTGITNTPTLDFYGTASGSAIYVAGNLTLDSTLVITDSTFANDYNGFYLTGNDDERHIVTNGVNIDGPGINFTGNGTYILDDAITVGGKRYDYGFVQKNGTVITNNQTIIINSGGDFVTTGTDVMSLDLGSSFIDVQDGKFWFGGSSLTLLSGTSTLNMTSIGTVHSFAGGDKTYYTVNLTSNGAYIPVTGNNTFNDMTVTNTANRGSIYFSGNQTFTASLTLLGYNTTEGRLAVYSQTRKETIDITAAAVSITNTTIQDMRGLGAADWDISAGNNIDGGDNFNITFTSSTAGNLYWVGGTETWSTAWGTKWSIVDGGFGGHAPPASSDNATFNANSGNVTVTLSTATCNDLDFTGFIGTLSASTGTLNIYGSLIMAPEMGITNDSSTINFKATSLGHTITSASRVLRYIIFDGIGGEWTLQDELTVATLRVNNGTFVSNNQTINLTGSGNVLWIQGGDSIFGTSFVEVSQQVYRTGGTVSAASATFNITSAGYFQGGGDTYGTLNITCGSTAYISGNNTFGDLGIWGKGVSVGDTITIYGDQIITNTLSLIGANDTTKRLRVASDVRGVSRALIAGILVSGNINVRDINGAGAADWDISAFSTSDFGGTTNITFTPAQDNFWVGDTGSWSDNVTHWASTSGGAPDTGRVPLPQDTAIFDENSVSADGMTITFDMYELSSINASSVLNNPMFTGASSVYIYGSVDFGTIRWLLPQYLYMADNANDTTISSANTTFLDIRFDSFSKTVTLQSSLNPQEANTLELISGTLDFNDFDLNIWSFYDDDNVYPSTLYLGNGTINLTAGWTTTASLLTLYCESSTITQNSLSWSDVTFNGGSKTYNNYIYTGINEGSRALLVTGSNTISNFTIDRSSDNKTVQLAASTITTINTFSVPVYGTTNATIRSSSTTACTINRTNSSVFPGDYMTLYYCNILGNTAFAGSHGTNSGGANTGWVFADVLVATSYDIGSLGITMAVGSGNITEDNGQYSITERGICYSTITNPTVTGNSTAFDSTNATGVYSVNMTGMSENTLYYTRAYVISDGVTSYGNQISFYTRPSGSGNMYQDIIGGGVSISTSAVRYCPVIGSDITTNDTYSQQVISSSGNFSSMLVNLSAAPGAGKSVTATFRINGVDTVMSCSISGTNTTANYTDSLIWVNAGDLVDIKVTPQGTPTISNISYSFLYQSEIARSSIVSSSMGGYFSIVSTPVYSVVSGVYRDTTTVKGNSITENATWQIIPTNGSFSNLYVYAINAPGTGNSANYTLRVNGVYTALSATIADDNYSANDTISTPIQVVPGDMVDIIAEYTGSITSTLYTTGMVFTPNTNGESITLHKSITSTITDRWSHISGSYGEFATAENAAQQVTHGTVFKNFYTAWPDIDSGGGGGSGPLTDYTFTFRANGANTALYVVNPGGGYTQNASETYYTYTAVDGDLVDIYNSGVGTYSNIGWSIVTYNAPAYGGLTVITLTATSVEATTATGNGNITDNGTTVILEKGICWSVAPNPDTTYNVSDTIDITGIFSEPITGLLTGTTFYLRAYAVNEGGVFFGADVTILTKPAAPTTVLATDGDFSDKVVITWTKATGATDYHVWRDAVDLGSAGDVASADDTSADAPTITPGSANATEGSIVLSVNLDLLGSSTTAGATYTYKVVASNPTGNSADSNTDTGYKDISSVNYQWQRSAADSDADYSNIIGATTILYSDTGAPANGDGRYYKCVQSADGVVTQTSTVDRGYRSFSAVVIVTLTSSNITSNSATITGDLSDLGSSASVDIYFEYGLTAAYGDETSNQTLTAASQVSINIVGLLSVSTYHFQVVAIGDSSTTFGGDLTFLTIGFSGNGTYDDPFLIHNVSELQDVSANLTAYYAVANSFDCSATTTWNAGAGFDPLGAFTGSIDGRGFEVSNLYINRPVSAAGLFYSVNTTEIAPLYNLSLINADITGNPAAIFSVYAGSDVAIDTISVSGNVTGGNSAGGLIAQTSSNVTIDSCNSSVSLYINIKDMSTFSYAGGTVGYGSGNVTLVNCHNSGNITNYEDSGGLVGVVSGNVTVDNCSFSGNVSISYVGYAGGLVAYGTNVYIDDSFFIGNVNSYESAGSPSVGGLVGGVANNSYINNSYFAGDITNFSLSATISGLVKRLGDNSSINNSYFIGDIADYGTSAGNTISGFVWYSGYDTYISNSYFIGNISSLTSGTMSGLVNYLDARSFITNTNFIGDITSIGDAAGLISESADNITLSDSYFVGNIIASGNTGGLVSYLSNDSDIINCSFTGDIINNSAGADEVGGLVGSIDDDSSITGSIFTGNITSASIGSSPGGLIGYASDNISVINCSATGNITGIGAAGLIGYIHFDGSVTDSYFTGNIISTGGSGDAGGLVVYADTSIFINNCYVLGNLVSGDGAGGLVSYVNDFGYITNSYFEGDILATGIGNTGGLVGFLDSSSYIGDCYATGNVTGAASDIGGLVGYSNSSNEIVDSNYTGNIVSTGLNETGGIAGYMNSSSLIDTCAVVGDIVSSASNTGGIVGYTSDSIDIVNSHFIGDIFSTSSNVGGITSYIDNDSLICECYAIGNINNIYDFATIGGLVGFVNDYIVIDISYYSGNITTENATDIGGLVGYIDSSNISNSYFSGDINALGGGGDTGGLASYIGDNTTINNCYTTGNLFSQSDYIGGLVGQSHGSANISNSYSDIDISDDAIDAVGGFIGYIASPTGPIFEYNIDESYATGSINAENVTNVGGFVGETDDTHVGGTINITNCYTRSDIVATNSTTVGGFAGELSSEVNIINSYSAGTFTPANVVRTGGFVALGQTYLANLYDCYWDFQLSGQPTSDGGTRKTTAEMKVQGTFNNWDFTNIWGLDTAQNDGYPYFGNNVVVPADAISVSGIPIYIEWFNIHYPTGAGSEVGWNGLYTDIDDNWKNVNDSNTIYSTTENSSSSYVFTQWSGNATISSVTVVVRAKRSYATDDIYLYYYEDGIAYNLGLLSPTSSYTDIPNTFANNPATGGSWNITSINGMEWGVGKIGTTGGIYISQLYVKVIPITIEGQDHLHNLGLTTVETDLNITDLISQGLVNSDFLDTRLTNTLGYMPQTISLKFELPLISAFETQVADLKLGYPTSVDSLSIIPIATGNFTVADATNLELGYNFEIGVNGVFEATKTGNIIDKEDAFNVSIVGTSNLSATIRSEGILLDDSVNSTQITFTGNNVFAQDIYPPAGVNINGFGFNIQAGATATGSTWVSINATDAYGKPISAAPIAVSNIIEASTISTITSEFVKYTFPEKVFLKASQNYSFEFYGPDLSGGTDSLLFYADNTNAYTSANAWLSSDNGTTWAELKASTINTDWDFVLLWSPQVKYPITSGAHSINITCSPIILNLVMDGISVDLAQVSAMPVPDNSNDWIFMSDVIPMATTITMSVVPWGAPWVETLQFTPRTVIQNAVLPDLDGGDNNGAFNYGTNPSGITVWVGPMTINEEFVNNPMGSDPYANMFVVPENPSAGRGADEAAIEEEMKQLPLYIIFHNAAESLGLPTSAMYALFYIAYSMGIGFLVYIISGTIIAGLGGVMLILALGISANVIPLWFLLVFIIMAFALVYLRNRM